VGRQEVTTKRGWQHHGRPRTIQKGERNMGDKIFKWYYAESDDAEHWHGPYDTKGEAVDAGVDHYEDDAFFVCEADKSVCKPPHLLLIDHIIDQNDRCWGEDGCEHEWTSEQEAELEAAVTAVIQDWLNKYPPATYVFGTTRNVSEIIPARALDTTDAGQ
jgi:hypothetical protein